MELTTKGRYAVMAMADLAARAVSEAYVVGCDDATPLTMIAERQHISVAYLEQIFSRLRKAGLVESARGRSGGYRLARPARDISVLDIMQAVEEGVRMTRCGGEHGSPCIPGERCITHSLWDALGAHINGFLDRVTLQQVIEGKVGQGHIAAPPRVLFSGGIVEP